MKTTMCYHCMLLKKLSSKRQEIANTGENVEKRKPWFTVCGNKN